MMWSSAKIRSRRRSKGKSGIDPQILIAPLIDVVFQLLIFFMLINRYVLPGIPLDLPSGSPEKIVLDNDRVVSITANGDIYLDDIPVTIQDISGILSMSHLKGEIDSVRLRADAHTEFQIVVDVLEAIRKAGIYEIAIETDIDKELLND